MTALAATTDTDLLQAYARQRNADAFAELVRRYASLIYGVGLRITQNRDDAQDIAQECFLQLATQAAQIAQPLPAWLHTLARSRAIDLTRRRSTRQRHEQQAMHQPGTALSLEQWNALSQQVDAAIAALPEDLRVPLVGAYLQGRTQQELAADLGLSQGSISRRIERAVEELREHLQKAGVDVPMASMAMALTDLASQCAAPAGLMADLTKMGLSGVAAKLPLVSKLPHIAAAVAICAALSGVIYWAIPGDVPTPSSPATKGATNMTSSIAPAQPADQLRRQNGKVWIEGLQPGQRDTNSYCQGLAILLQHLGHKDATYTRVMGYSGVAFALQMDLSGPIRDGKYDVAWWPNDSYAFDLRIGFLGQAFGLDLRKISSDPAAPQTDVRQQYQSRFAPAIIEAINQGYPVLGNQDSAVLVTGYDQATRQPILLWPSPGQPAFGPSDGGIPCGIYVPGKALQPLTQDQAEIQSLRWAISLWDETAVGTAKGGDTSKILTGSKAYATWLELLQQQADGVGLGRDSWDNNLIFHLRYNRTAAAAYLRDLATRQPAASAAHLRTAADLYQSVADAAARAPLWGQFSANPEVRPQKLQEYTDIIRRASRSEAQAIDEIRQVVAPAPVTP